MGGGRGVGSSLAWQHLAAWLASFLAHMCWQRVMLSDNRVKILTSVLSPASSFVCMSSLKSSSLLLPSGNQSVKTVRAIELKRQIQECPSETELMLLTAVIETPRSCGLCSCGLCCCTCPPSTHTLAPATGVRAKIDAERARPELNNLCSAMWGNRNAKSAALWFAAQTVQASSLAHIFGSRPRLVP